MGGNILLPTVISVLGYPEQTEMIHTPKIRYLCHVNNAKRTKIRAIIVVTEITVDSMPTETVPRHVNGTMPLSERTKLHALPYTSYRSLGCDTRSDPILRRQET